MIEILFKKLSKLEYTQYYLLRSSKLLFKVRFLQRPWKESIADFQIITLAGRDEGCFISG